MSDHGAGDLLVTRPANGPRDRLRGYEIAVDGEAHGTVRVGETLTVPLSSGAHRVRARMGRFSSPEEDVEIAAGSRTELFVGPSDAVVGVADSFGKPDYLCLVARRDDLPEPSLQLTGFSRLPGWARVAGAVLLLLFVLPHQVTALRSGDALRVTAAVALVLFWLWLAWSMVRRGDRTRSAFWRRQSLWWTGWLVVAAVIALVAASQHRLHAGVVLYLALPALGALSSWAVSRWTVSAPREG